MPGRPFSPIDLLIARRQGLATVSARRPTVAILNVGDDGRGLTAAFVSDFVTGDGATVGLMATSPRDLGSLRAAIDRMLEQSRSDVLVLVGGTGRGRSDHTGAALGSRTEAILHGIALRPGTTAAVARIGARPVIALPGLPDQAVAATLALVRPVLDRLSARAPRAPLRLPLAAKIASAGGLAEIALLRRAAAGGSGDTLLPIAVGTFSLASLARADAFAVIPAGSEGSPAGMPIEAFPLMDGS